MSAAPQKSASPNASPAMLSLRKFHEEDKLKGTYDMALLKRLLPFARPDLGILVVALILMPITSGVSLLQPLLLGKAVSAVVVEKSLEPLLNVVFMYMAVLLADFVGRVAQIYLMQLAGQKTMARLRRSVFSHIQKLPIRYFDKTPVGRVVTRVTNDVDSLSEFFASGAVTAIADLLTLVGIVFFMLYLDWELSLVAFTALPPLAVLVSVFRKFARTAFRDIRARISQLNAFLSEQVNGIAVIQAFNRQERCAAEYESINAGYRDANYQAIRYDALLYSIVESVSVASIAVILWYASTKAELLDPDTSAAYLPIVVAFYEYIQRFFVPIRDLATKYTIIQSSLAAAERVFTILDEPPAPDFVESEPDLSLDEEPDGDVAIELDEVTFGYRKDTPVLHELSLAIKKGETVAIVGPTGSGKTTVISLLLRLYEVGQGVIRVGGTPIEKMTQKSLRNRFAVVPQDVFLFVGTVLDNVCLGLTPDRARAEAVLRQVGVWDKLSQGKGLDSQVSERGQNFSAGERQLLAFARALYRDPPILVLDEATANVDSESEARVQSAVRALLADRTALVIAHRLSTIREADRIIVLHRGRLAESGTHEELMSKQGIYARLHQLQFAHTSGPSAPPERAA